MTIPMGMSGEMVSSASQDMLETLATAEKLFWEHMSHIARRGHVSSVREAAVCLTLIRTFRTSLGRGDKHTPVLAAQLLGQLLHDYAAVVGADTRAQTHPPSLLFAERCLRSSGTSS